MEKQRFEFQKLELPEQIQQKTDPNSNKSIQSRYTNFGYFIFTAIVFFILGFFLHYFLKPPAKESKIHNVSPVFVDSTKVKHIEKPIYFNYYDSMLFLNQIKGHKMVISKGFDDYIKKNKLIVKVNDYYYNLFCDDLINNYAVGDSIP